MRWMSVAAAALALPACAGESQDTAQVQGEQQQQFFYRLTAHCGKAYAGKLVSKDETDQDFVGKPMRIHFANCAQSEIRIPLHVEMKPGEWDRSRTWIISRTAIGLRLKHDHRHEDGKPDIVTMYGGDTESKGTAARQEFPVDRESISLFKENGLAASVTNIWAIKIDDSSAAQPKYAYELRRENRHFRVEFDLTKPVAPPPPAWGQQD